MFIISDQIALHSVQLLSPKMRYEKNLPNIILQYYFDKKTIETAIHTCALSWVAETFHFLSGKTSPDKKKHITFL